MAAAVATARGSGRGPRGALGSYILNVWVKYIYILRNKMTFMSRWDNGKPSGLHTSCYSCWRPFTPTPEIIHLKGREAHRSRSDTLTLLSNYRHSQWRRSRFKQIWKRRKKMLLTLALMLYLTQTLGNSDVSVRFFVAIRWNTSGSQATGFNYKGNILTQII